MNVHYCLNRQGKVLTLLKMDSSEVAILPRRGEVIILDKIQYRIAEIVHDHAGLEIRVFCAKIVLLN